MDTLTRSHIGFSMLGPMACGHDDTEAQWNVGTQTSSRKWIADFVVVVEIILRYASVAPTASVACTDLCTCHVKYLWFKHVALLAWVS